MRTVFHELLHVDGTLWRTLRLLFVRPGRLSLEYVAGRRRPYINPFRLPRRRDRRLRADVVLRAHRDLELWTSDDEHRGRSLGGTAPSKRPSIGLIGLLRRHLAAKQKQLVSDAAREQFHRRLEAFAEPLSFANVVLLAAALHLCFR